ncbi:TolC family protein [Novipirellula artificiosorum]|uniref:Outer membrane efflux protein n=1 Tax=Novipirellula artificiosorum TaxID=2528016 RepID=A0A5C6D2Y1_9BACT|nr:TolC family protein [Novipirellula artificiosorum]TWU31543.1 Outer membrane efflux protein [Novipirellula artificiosorum]
MVLACAVIGSTIAGCRGHRNLSETVCNDTACIDAIMKQVDAGAPAISIPDVSSPPLTVRTIEDFAAVDYQNLSLNEAIQTALEHSEVMRDLGATVLRAPQTLITQQTKPLAEFDPQTSIESALSAFDAQLYAMGKWQNNDRKFNNRFFGGGANAFKQDTHDYIAQLSKRTATGAELAVRNVIDYDANNATGNITDSAWQSQIHAEMRQPLMQGGGIQFNRIAGPASQPGIYSGVLVAKVNNDITSSRFRQGTRDFLSNVVNAYWDLYFAYRDLDAKREALERSRQTWQSYEAQKSSNRKSGAAEALAREQYFRFQSELQDAIAGKLIQRTQVNNSTSGGTFAGLGGVLAAERRLRLLIGLPVTSSQLLRPMDEPLSAPMVFDWDSISVEALRLRGELQQQRLLVKRREMEVLAARNFLMPSLDLVTIYRVRGLDKDLAGDRSAYSELGSFDFQEYEAGLEFKLPIGLRQGYLAVRHAKTQLVRDRAVLEEQERQVLHDLAAVVGESDRAFLQMQTNMNRYLAASEALEVLETNREAGMPVNLEQLLDAQRRVSESQSRYFLSLTEYTLAAKNVQFEKGTLLQAANLFLVDEEFAIADFAEPTPMLP